MYNPKKLFCCFVIILQATTALVSTGKAQQIKWYNPDAQPHPVVQGQAFAGEEREGFYHRLPKRFANDVRTPLWAQSRHSAGESLCFSTDAKDITIRYIRKGALSMYHMPMTGTSGTDLYTTDKNGQEIWIAGKYSFGDTVICRYKNIEIENGTGIQRYTLFLPLYNEVCQLEVGVENYTSFRFDKPSGNKPIVAYGTSICQGACASRPGMAWTNIVQRRMGHTVVNMGFSGNAFFEKEVMAILAQIDAKVYIIDAMPNAYTIETELLQDSIVKAIHNLHAARPHTPILLTDHLGYPHGKAMKEFRTSQIKALDVLKKSYKQLKEEGVDNLYYLTYEELAMPQDGTVEGIHTSDYGMMRYAEAYEKKLRQILNEPVGEEKTTIPITQQRDSYNWLERHNSITSNNKGQHYDRVIIGNSIIHFWGGVDGAPAQRGKESWENLPGTSLNLGFGWDKTENVLWRIYHGELDNITAEKIFLKIGTNNLSTGESDREIGEGIAAILYAISQRHPEASVTLMGILPRRGMEERIKKLNLLLQDMAQKAGVKFDNPGIKLLKQDGTIDESLFTDGLHPNKKGYSIIAPAFE